MDKKQPQQPQHPLNININISIRNANIDDLGAIVEIHNQAITLGQKTADTTPFSVPQRIKWFEDHTPDKHPIWVATKNNIIVGYLTISAYRSGREALSYTAEVSYYIHNLYHRQGIASNLLQYAIENCPSLKIKTLIAILIGSNHGSIKVLEKFGFEKWGEMPQIAEFKDVKVSHLYYGLSIILDSSVDR